MEIKDKKMKILYWSIVFGVAIAYGLEIINLEKVVMFAFLVAVFAFYNTEILREEVEDKL